MSSKILLEAALWITVGLYALASVFFILQVSFQHRVFAKLSWSLTGVGLAVHIFVVLFRWHLVGHGPYRTIHEILVCDSSFIIAAFVVTGIFYDKIRSVGFFVVPLALLMMGTGLMSSGAGAYLSPSLRSPWLVVHVLFAKMTVGSIVLATGLAGGLILRGRWSKLNDLLPDNQRISLLCHQLIQVAFIFSSMMIIAGAIWANDAWGRYWGWDPVETWSLITWGIYGLILHLRLTWKLPDKAYAALVAGAFVVSLVAYFLIPYGVESVHSQYFSL